MTGLSGCLWTLGLSAVTAGAVLLTQSGSNESPSGTVLTAGIEAESRVSSEPANAAVAAEGDATLDADASGEDQNTCAVDCVSPCANMNGCASPAAAVVEAAGEFDGGADVKVESARGDGCGCPTAAQESAVTAEAGAGVEAEASSQEANAAADANGSLSADTGVVTTSADGSATIEAEVRLE